MTTHPTSPPFQQLDQQVWKPLPHLYNSKAVISVCVGTYQAIDSDAGDDSPLEGPQDEHGKGHDDPDLPRFVLCGNTRVCQSKLQWCQNNSVV